MPKLIHCWLSFRRFTRQLESGRIDLQGCSRRRAAIQAPGYACKADRRLWGGEIGTADVASGSASARQPRELTAGKLTLKLSHRIADIRGRQWTTHTSPSTRSEAARRQAPDASGSASVKLPFAAYGGRPGADRGRRNPKAETRPATAAEACSRRPAGVPSRLPTAPAAVSGPAARAVLLQLHGRALHRAVGAEHTTVASQRSQ